MPSQQGIERARRLLRGEPDDEGFLGAVRRRAEGLLSAGEQLGEYGVHGVREALGGLERGARFLEERGEAVRGSLRGADLPGEFGPGVPGAVPGALQAASGALPAVRPEVAQSIPGRVIGAVGQVAPALPLGAMGGMQAAGIYGAIQEGQGRYEEVIGRLGESKDSYQKAQTARLVGSGLGLLEALPVAKVMGRLDRASGGLAGRLLGLYARLPSAVGGGVTEGVQSALGDLAVEHLTGQDLDVLRNAAQEALYGGAAFGILGAFAKAFRGTDAEPSTTVQDIPLPSTGVPRASTTVQPEPISSEVSDLSAERPKPAAAEPKRKDRGFLQDLRSEPRELAEPETEEHRRFARLIEEASDEEFRAALAEFTPEETTRLIEQMGRGYLPRDYRTPEDVDVEALEAEIEERVFRGDEVAQREADLAQRDLPESLPDRPSELTVVRQIEREGRIYTQYTRPGQRPRITERERAEAAARTQAAARAPQEVQAFPGNLLPEGAISRFFGGRRGRGTRRAQPSEPGPEDQTLYVPPERYLGAIARRFQDFMRPVRKAQEAVLKQRGLEELPEESDTYLADELRRGRTAAKLDKFERGVVQPLLRLYRRPGIDEAEASRYLIALHAPERNRLLRERYPGRARRSERFGAGMSDAEAAAIVARAENGPAGKLYREIASRVRSINKSTLQRRVDYGLLSKEEADFLESIYPNYVPLRTFVQAGRGDRVSGRGVHLGRLKKARGRVSLADNPAAFSMVQYEATIAEGEHNRVRQALLQFVRDNPSGYWDVSEGRPKRFDPETGEFLPIDERLTLSERSVGVMVDGKEWIITFSPDVRLVPHAIKQMGVVRVSRYLRFLQTATRTYSKLRTMWDPDFMAPNLLKDWQTAGIQLGDPESARVNVRRALSVPRVRGALAELWRYSRDKPSRGEWRPWLERAVEDGMPVSWVHPKAIEERLADFERAIQDMRPDQSVWSRFREFLRLVEDGNFAAENAVRLAAYRASVEAGISRARSASIAKNLTVNWERIGEVGPALSTGWAFMNARIQGPARLARSLARSRRAQVTAVGLVGAGFSISLLNRMLAWDDEDGENAWDATADWQKERNVAIAIPGQRRFFTLPFTWGWNFFLNLGYQLEATVNGGKRPLDAALSVAHSAVNAFMPFDTEGSVAQLGAPTILDPIVAVSENKDWKGSPIRRENYPGQHKPESEMAWDSTGSLMREAGRALNALTGGDPIRPGWIEKLPGHLSSPDTLEHYYEFITGGPGRFFERSMEALSRGFKVPVNNVPIVRRFMMEPPEWGVSQRYFANLREYESIEDSIRYWRREGREPLARNLEREWQSVLRLEQEMKRAERFRKDKRRSEEEVQANMAEFNRAYRRAKAAQEER